MERLVELIDEKNHYLEKFCALNAKEMNNFRIGKFDNLRFFYESRENILEIVHYLDEELEDRQNLIPPAVKLPVEDKEKIRKALNRKDELVKVIVDQDLEIISCLEETRMELLKELSGVQQGRRAMRGYGQKASKARVNEKF